MDNMTEQQAVLRELTVIARKQGRRVLLASADEIINLRKEKDRLRAILATLREPSEAALDAATAAMQDAFFAFRVRHLAYDMDTQYAMDTLDKLPAIKSPPPAWREQQDKVFVAGVRAAVAAAEQEVDRG